MKKHLLLVLALAVLGFTGGVAQPVLYGVTSMGGSSDGGTLFEFDAATHALTVRNNFVGANGAKPYGRLLSASNGMLYGTTSEGGSNGYGTLFQYNPKTRVISTKANFNYAATGAYSFGNLFELTNGDIVGVCSSGGAGGYGTLWRYRPSANTLTKLKDFDATTGAYPYSGVMQASNGKLYGVTTNYGSGGWGTFYEFDLTANTFSILQAFSGANGAYGFGELIEVGEKLYGLTYMGGTNNVGTIFEYDLRRALFVTRYHFDDGTHGGSPYGGGLSAAPRGLLYGTNTSGGDNQAGVLFSFDPGSGQVGKLYDFDYHGSGYSYSPVMNASDGNLYGMTNQAERQGTYDDGTIFQFNLEANAYASIFNFNAASGSQPYWTGLTEAKPVHDPCEDNVAPVITAVNAPEAAQPVSASVKVDVSFVDTNASTGTIDWGDGITTPGTINEQHMTGMHSYDKPGIYSLKLSVVDACKLETNTTYQYVIIFDSNSSCAKGEGSINSPRNACGDHPNIEGKATFELEVGYAKGGKKPAGNLSFAVKSNKGDDHEYDRGDDDKEHGDDDGEGDHDDDNDNEGHDVIKLKATSFDWMVVNGNVAIGQGKVTMNGDGGYSFAFSVVDGAYQAGKRDEEKENHRSDKFRITIWNKEGVVYDNDPQSPLYAPATQYISSGYIVLRNCGDDDDDQSIVKEDSAVKPGVEFFPNPVKSRMTVKVPDASAETSFYMVDFSGRQYTLNRLPSSSSAVHTFDVEDLPSGLYVLRVQNGPNTSMVKIMK